MEDLRLMDILAQFYVADPKSVKWDDSGSCDTVSFTTSGKDKRKYLLKLSRDNAKANGNTLDFRVRVVTMQSDAAEKEKSDSFHRRSTCSQ